MYDEASGLYLFYQLRGVQVFYMKNAILSLIDICLLPFGLLLPSETETWGDKMWATVDVARAICYAGIIVVPLCILGILLLLSNVTFQYQHRIIEE